MDYSVTMRHDEKSLEALAHMQYDLFCRGNRIARSALSVIAVFAGIIRFQDWWGILLIAYGCYLVTSTYSSANHTAHKLAKQIRESGMPFPASRYTFGERAMQIDALEGKEASPEPLAYAQVCRLGEDAGYFYLFRDQYGGYMIPKEQLGERAESFRAFVEGKTGQRFRSRLAPVVRLMRRLGAKKG